MVEHSPGQQSADGSVLHTPVRDWYAAHARDLPWRAPGASAWGVLVSEVMLQQTPVVRVEPVWRDWLRRWPSPAGLAAEPVGEAVNAWGRLGYPRRALRLHATATALVEQHQGEVPTDPAALEALPGVGRYTAAAVAAFAFGIRTPVLDTNVRRVLGRVLDGAQFPPPHLAAAEWRRAEALLPADDAEAARWSVAVMELGALVCTARSPRCERCPLAQACRWRGSGFPPYQGPPRRGQAWHGTDRQCRGRLLQAVREAHPVPIEGGALIASVPDPDQARRCLAGLVTEGLLHADETDYRLPG